MSEPQSIPSVGEENTTAPSAAAGASRAVPSPESWTIDFSAKTTKRKVTKREQEAIEKSRSRDVVVQSDVVVVNVNDLPLDESSLIPRDLTTTREDILQRMHMDVPRLLCIAKQYPKSCGVTSLTSVWNLLYSRIGYGTLPPVSQEEVMSILGFQPPFDTIRWGPFCGNTTLLRWFHCINRHFNVQGKAYYLYKVHGLGRTPMSPDEAQTRFRETLRNPHAAVVYHCHNHYMVPVGYQMIPRHQSDCYKPHVGDDASEMTVFIGEVSRGKHPAMHAVKWKDIVADLSTVLPEYVNIRHAELGVQVRHRKPAAAKPAASDCGDVPQPEDIPSSSGTAVDSNAVDTSNSSAAMSSAPPRLATPPAAASSSAPTRKVMNLHCLLVFRNDQVEDDMQQFEDDDDEEDAAATGRVDDDDDGDR